MLRVQVHTYIDTYLIRACLKSRQKLQAVTIKQNLQLLHGTSWINNVLSTIYVLIYYILYTIYYINSVYYIDLFTSILHSLIIIQILIQFSICHLKRSCSASKIFIYLARDFWALLMSLLLVVLYWFCTFMAPPYNMHVSRAQHNWKMKSCQRCANETNKQTMFFRDREWNRLLYRL